MTILVITDKSSSLKYQRYRTFKNMDDNEISYEPMDVDLSYNSVNAMDISYTESFDYSKVIIKKEKDLDDSVKVSCFDYSKVIIKKEKNLDDSVKDSCRSPSPVEIKYVRQTKTVLTNNNQTKSLKKYYILLSCLTFLLISSLAYQLSQFQCCEDFKLESLKTSLQTRLYGQTATIDTLIRALEQNVSKILILYGGTGVGKTLTASLILDNKLNYSNIYHYTMPSFLHSFTSELMVGHTFCKSSMVIVDDLQGYDIISVEEHLHELVNKSNRLSKVITIILVYNCDNMHGIFLHKCETFLWQLKKNLNGINAAKYYIKYNHLTEEHLKKCIKNELKNKIISENDLSKIVKNFNVTLDGCKGVYQKMKYLNIV